MGNRKKFKTFLTLTIIVAFIMASTTMVFAASPKISKTEVNIDVGSAITLKVLNVSKKVSWGSSNKNVATVKSTGTKTAKVTAKKEGKAIITAKINGKKYKCTVTAKYKLGSRQNPVTASEGVTVTTMTGKATYIAKNILVGTDAENLFKAISPKWWEYHMEYNKEEIQGNKLVALEYDVKAGNGYDDYGLTGYEIISPYDLYNEQCNASLEGAGYWMFESTKNYTHYSDLELYDGGAATMYAFLLVPEEVKAFTRYHYDKNFKKYWVKYNLPQ